MSGPVPAGDVNGRGLKSETAPAGLRGAFEDLANSLGLGDSGRATPGTVDELALTPGMPVEVHIRTGDRSVISYLTKPITDFFQRSMREE